MRIVATAVTVLLTALPAGASRPGQPLDCSDWVFLEPGFPAIYQLDQAHVIACPVPGAEVQFELHTACDVVIDSFVVYLTN